MSAPEDVIREALHAATVNAAASHEGLTDVLSALERAFEYDGGRRSDALAALAVLVRERDEARESALRNSEVLRTEIDGREAAEAALAETRQALREWHATCDFTDETVLARWPDGIEAKTIRLLAGSPQEAKP